jgi:hypothetical protein
MRRRNMYYLTGLPGWMRFGYSPGRGGLGPCAQFLLTGQWPTPQMAAAWQAMQAGGTPPQPAFWPGRPLADRTARLQMLKSQAQVLEAQLQQLRAAIAQLEQEQSGSES